MVKNLDAYKLKWLAVIGMILNHMVIGWWEAIPLWFAVPMYMAGGITFPIMGYLAVEGYKYTRNLRKYLYRLFGVGVIAMLFHPLVMRVFMLNIMFTLVVGLLAIVLYDTIKSKPLFWSLFVLLCLLTAVPIVFDWAVIGVVMMLMCHIIKNEKRKVIMPVVVGSVLMLAMTSLAVWSMHFIKNTPELAPYAEEIVYAATFGHGMIFIYMTYTFVVGMLLSIWLLLKYNGQRGKKSGKALFYVIYPLHLAIIGGVALLAGWVGLSVFLVG